MTNPNNQNRQEQPKQDGQDAVQPAEKLKEAEEKLARMEATNRICFRHRADFAKLESELKQFNYSPAELDHILEPKGAKNIPGFSFPEMQSQRQFVARLSSRTSPSDHGTPVKHGRQRVDELVE